MPVEAHAGEERFVQDSAGGLATGPVEVLRTLQEPEQLGNGLPARVEIRPVQALQLARHAPLLLAERVHLGRELFGGPVRIADQVQERVNPGFVVRYLPGELVAQLAVRRLGGADRVGHAPFDLLAQRRGNGKRGVVVFHRPFRVRLP
ncbi:MAG TPA: hypothetical protein VL551_35050 [Actinospica sp.]|nr:hypothetical protein [Actinospica sp.]